MTGASFLTQDGRGDVLGEFFGMSSGGFMDNSCSSCWLIVLLICSMVYNGSCGVGMCRIVPDEGCPSYVKYTVEDGGRDGMTNLLPTLRRLKLTLDSYWMLKTEPEGRVGSRTKSMDSMYWPLGGW